MKLDFSMAKAGDKYIGELEFQRPDGEYDVWTIVKRLDPAVAGSSPKGYPIYLIGTATNSGLLSDYYYKPERGESESKSLEEINADLEVLAQDGESYMSRVKRIPKKGLKKNPYVVKEGKAFVGKFDTRREALDEIRAVASRIYNFGAESLTDRFKRMASLKMRYVRKNPPFYAHNLYEKKTHGLTLHQMRRLYAMVSRGNQKAITYARNVLGIPFSESPTQVKAVVYHHVRDLAERRVRRNPGGYVIGYGPDPYSVYDVIAESKDGSRYIAFYMLTRSEAKKQAERLKRNLGEKTYIVYHPRDRKGNLLGHPSSLLKGTRYYNDFYKYVRKNPMEYDVLRDKFEVMGGPITDKMQSLLRKIYNMRDAGKSEAQLRPFIKEYQRLKGLVTPLRRNQNRKRRRK